ncbi:MAG TPA: pyridoxal phosphate-dependent aminotransferase family protein [Bacteroidia bacterium]|jgi:8-amino-7-oxononanoate synthase
MSENILQKALEKRASENSLRTLPASNALVDFCSNDYLGFARSEELADLTKKEFEGQPLSNGSTGSRLLTGNSAYAEQLEGEIAAFHHAEAGLIFNSGYDANTGLFSSIAKRGDTIIADEYVHASIIDGIRLSRADHYRFRHDDMNSLEQKLKLAKGNVFVAIESVYSMDGDYAELEGTSELCKKYNAKLIVDEAHATGVLGEGRGFVCHNKMEREVFARVHTFGKALGCHGAIVLGSNELRSFLINFSRPFIYSTALPLHSLCAIRSAYKLLDQRAVLVEQIDHWGELFSDLTQDLPGKIQSESPIHCFVVPGNEKVKALARKIREAGYDVRAILSPTVPRGKERIRICLHAFNTEAELRALALLLQKVLNS